MLRKVFLLLLFSGSATSFALTFAEALQRAAVQPLVLAAEQGVAAARDEVTRTTADPAALKLERVQAQQRLIFARAQTRQAHYQAAEEIGSAFSAALLAEQEAQLAATNERLSRGYLADVTRRLQNGEATRLEVRETAATLGVAVANRQYAAVTASLRLQALSSLVAVDLPVSPEAIAGTWIIRPLPPLSALLGRLDDTVTLLAARQAYALAQLNLEVLGPRYSAPRSRVAAAAQRTAAAVALANTRRSVREQLQTLYAQTEAAQRLYQAQTEVSAAAQTRFGRQRQALARGSISELEFRQAAYTAGAAELELHRTSHQFFISWLALQKAAASQF